jgi:hypothetical protein
MNWQLRSIAWNRLGEMPEDTIMITGRLHGPDRCICPQCCALEETAVLVAELLQPGQQRQIALEGSPLFLTVRRHQPLSPRSGRSSVAALPQSNERSRKSPGRGDLCYLSAGSRPKPGAGYASRCAWI